jgi:GNAT superfamily N-acetyltransferase
LPETVKKIKIQHCSFAEVKPLWHLLWGGSYDFQPTSCMLYLRGYDGNIPHRYTPVFLGAYSEDTLIGVLSGHKTTEEHFRGRGLFILPEHRNSGVASLLIAALIQEARKSGANLLWAAPRKTNLPLFLKLGFEQASDFTNEGFQFGPNCYVRLLL